MLKDHFQYKMLDSYCDNIIIFIDLKLENVTLKINYMYGPNIDLPWFYENLNNIVQNSEFD